MSGRGIAAAEFQKILDHSGSVWNCWTGSLAHLGLARANGVAVKKFAERGRRHRACPARLAAYKEFMALWKNAYSDIPILKQAEAEYEKIAMAECRVGGGVREQVEDVFKVPRTRFLAFSDMPA